LIIGMVLIQFSLGVSTLLLGVPILIAVLHQAGAMLLLISVVHFLNGLRQS
ncbi:MAG: COX15/CtaA family protein, partial [Flavobacteriales bacterium]|nr:COX15/CtaA family protein [Flavobacteriales bacterium]